MKFSIVITSTRPHLLQYSLKSALAQTFDDYEIVVSDNSPMGCRDMVDSLGGGRVQYVRPSKPLTLTDHWNFAFSHARGEWHLQLCDDDAITPNLLAILNMYVGQVGIDSVFWDYGAYYTDAAEEAEGTGARLSVGSISPETTRYDSDTLLAEMFNSGTGLFRIKQKIPFFPRVVCRRQVLDSIRRRQGVLFHPFCPMTSGAVALLAFSRSTLHLNLPLLLLGSTTNSCAGWVRDPTTMDASHAGIDVELAPIKAFRVMPTAMADALLRTQRAMPELLGRFAFGYVNYFLHCHLFLESARERGFDTAPYRQVFIDALERMPPDIQEAVRAAIAAEPQPSTPGYYVRAKRSLLAILHSFRQPRVPGVVRAERLGLRNILDCAKYVGEVVDRRLNADLATQ